MFVVLELQRSGESSLATLTDTFVDQDMAEQKYHTILAAAAVSQIGLHSAVMLTEDGRVLKSESYRHGNYGIQESM